MCVVLVLDFVDVNYGLVELVVDEDELSIYVFMDLLI